MAIASQTDLEQRLQIDFTLAADPVAASLLDAAQAHIERELGRPIVEAARTERFDAYDYGRRRQALFLRFAPVISITSVKEDGGAALPTTDYQAYPWTAASPIVDSRLIRLSGGYQIVWQATKPQGIEVVYQGGWPSASVPKDLIDACAWLAADSFRVGANFAAMPAAADGVQSVSLEGSDSVTFTPRTPDWPHSIAWPRVFEMLDRVAGYYRTPAIA